MKQPLFACLSFVQRWLLIFKLKHLLLHFPYLSKSSDQQLTVGFRHPYIRAYSIRTILWVTLLVSKINVFRQLTAPHQPLTFTVGCMSRLVEVAQTTMKTDLRCKHCRKKIQKENSSNFHSSVYKKNPLLNWNWLKLYIDFYSIFPLVFCFCLYLWADIPLHNKNIILFLCL